MSTERTDSPGGDTPAGAARDDGRGTPRPRRRLSVLTVAAAVLIAGGGSAYWASTALSDSRGVEGAGAPPPLALDGFTAERTGARQAGPGAGTSYRPAAPLPEEGPDRAHVHRMAQGPDRKAVAELAEALDVPGTVRREGSTWWVGDTDGDGPVLRVSARPSGAWSYRGEGASHVRVRDLSEDATATPSPKERDTAAVAGHGTPVSEERAERAARRVLEAAGIERATVDGAATADGLRFVRLVPEVAGHPVAGLPTTVAVDGRARPVYAAGTLLSLEEGPEYPVLSAEETLRELNRRPLPREMAPCPKKPTEADGADGADEADGADDAGTTDRDGAAAVAHRDGRPDGSGPHLLPCATDQAPATARVTDATFLLKDYSAHGEVLLVPAWRFTLDAPTAARDARTTVTYPAVPARYLGGGKAPEGGEATRLPDGSADRLDTGGVEVESYRATDRKLTVHFWGGVCADYSATAEESASRVTVTLEAKRHEGHCVAVAKRQSVTVTLEKPVGDRTVTDEDGTRLPERTDS